MKKNDIRVMYAASLTSVSRYAGAAVEIRLQVASLRTLYTLYHLRPYAVTQTIM